MKRRCEKCFATKRLTRHHILPKYFYKGNGGISVLCVECHRDIEDIIHTVETKFSGSKSKRFNLGEKAYQDLLRWFLVSNPND